MKKHLWTLLLTVVIWLSLSGVPALAANEATYGIYNREDGSVRIVSSEVTAGVEYPMIAIVQANGNILMSEAGGVFTASDEGKNTFVLKDVGKIDDVTGWKVIIRGKFEIAASGPLQEDTEEPPVEQDILVTGVKLDKSTASVKIGETVALTATVEPADAANKTVTWSSSNTSVAAVSDGVVTGAAEGTAIITVTTEDGGKTASCTVTVTSNTPTPPTPPDEPPADIPVTGLTLNRTSLSLYVGDDSTLIAVVSPDDATDPTVTWSSSNPLVATVTDDGKVYAVGTGMAEITAKAGDLEAVCEVTVIRYVDNSDNDRPYRPSTSSGSSSSRVTRHRITVESGIVNGKVITSPTSAAKGAAVTITVTPNAGYRLERITATDKDGGMVNLTEQNNRYTFTMPDSDVEVSAAFEELKPTTPSTPSTPSQPGTSFTDVAYGAYYYDAVQWAVAQGITNGTGTGTFSPNSPCTRAQIVTFLWRAAGSPVSYGSSQFTDVSSNDYFYDAVQWAVENGITNGTGTGTFSPNETCTRAQAVTFLYRYAGTPAASGSSAFTDVPASAYYADAVRWAVGNQITNGTSTNTFSPSDICTRGHIVTFLYRDLAA